MVGKPSLLGTKKAVSIWKIPKDRALIVAVRGTASKVDHMVNLSHTAGNTPSLMVRLIAPIVFTSTQLTSIELE